MPAPRITPTAAQRILVNTDYDLPIVITGLDTDRTGHTVSVTGLLQGFYFNWDNATDTLHILGRPEREVTDVWTVIARNPDGDSEMTIDYKVTRPRPVIADVAAVTITKGQPFSVVIPVSNHPTAVDAHGALLGLFAKKVETGIEISGTVPSDAVFTVGSGTFRLSARNSGGEATNTLDWRFAGSKPIVTTSVPTAPRNVAATAGDGEITLSWSAPSSDGGSAITGYRVRVGSGSWVSKGASATSHTFTELTNGTTYTVEVQAQNSAGYSTSATATATVSWTDTWQTLTGINVSKAGVGIGQMRIKTSGGSSSRGMLQTFTLTTLESAKAVQVHISTDAVLSFMQALSTTKKLRIYDTDAKWVEYEILAFRGSMPRKGYAWWINLKYETSSGTWTNTDPSTLNLALGNS